MARVKIKGVEALAKKLNANLKIALNKLFRDAELRKQIGKIVVDDIKKNVSFGPPSSSTKKWRERYDKLNATDPAYSKNKVKAVFTGELLEDLANNVKGITTSKSFEIAHSDKRHKKYQGVNGKIGSRSPYSKISEGLVSGLGYDYFQISDKAQKELVDLVRDKIFKILA